MNSASCFLFIFLISTYNVGRILSQLYEYKIPSFTIPLTRYDHRLEKAYPNETQRFKQDLAADTHVGVIGLGVPEQSNFRIQFSTRHVKSWIFSGRYDGYAGKCRPASEVVQRIHNLYDYKNSSTYHSEDTREGAFIRHEEADWAFGYKTKDTLTIQGASSKEYVTQEFVEIVDSTESFTYGKPDGIISLRYKPNQQHENFIGRLCGEHSQFSFYFPRKTKEFHSDGTPGQLALCGAYVSRYIRNNMVFVNDKAPGQWRIDIESISVPLNNGSAGMIAENVEAVFDTTADRITGPQILVYKIYKHIGNFNIFQWAPYRYHIDCELRDTAPTIYFKIKGISFPLDAYSYTRKLDTPDGKTSCEILFCYTPNIFRDVRHWVLGDTFLRSMYTVFDIKNRVVGIANAPVSPPS